MGPNECESGSRVCEAELLLGLSLPVRLLDKNGNDSAPRALANDWE